MTSDDSEQFLEELIHPLTPDQSKKIQSIFDESTAETIRLIKEGKAKVIE